MDQKSKYDLATKKMIENDYEGAKEILMSLLTEGYNVEKTLNNLVMTLMKLDDFDLIEEIVDTHNQVLTKERRDRILLDLYVRKMDLEEVKNIYNRQLLKVPEPAEKLELMKKIVNVLVKMTASDNLEDIMNTVSLWKTMFSSVHDLESYEKELRTPKFLISAYKKKLKIAGPQDIKPLKEKIASLELDQASSLSDLKILILNTPHLPPEATLIKKMEIYKNEGLDLLYRMTLKTCCERVNPIEKENILRSEFPYIQSKSYNVVDILGDNGPLEPMVDFEIFRLDHIKDLILILTQDRLSANEQSAMILTLRSILLSEVNQAGLFDTIEALAESTNAKVYFDLICETLKIQNDGRLNQILRAVYLSGASEDVKSLCSEESIHEAPVHSLMYEMKKKSILESFEGLDLKKVKQGLKEILILEGMNSKVYDIYQEIISLSKPPSNPTSNSTGQALYVAEKLVSIFNEKEVALKLAESEMQKGGIDDQSKMGLSFLLAKLNYDQGRYDLAINFFKPYAHDPRGNILTYMTYLVAGGENKELYGEFSNLLKSNRYGEEDLPELQTLLAHILGTEFGIDAYMMISRLKIEDEIIRDLRWQCGIHYEDVWSINYFPSIFENAEKKCERDQLIIKWMNESIKNMIHNPQGEIQRIKTKAMTLKDVHSIHFWDERQLERDENLDLKVYQDRMISECKGFQNQKNTKAKELVTGYKHWLMHPSHLKIVSEMGDKFQYFDLRTYSGNEISISPEEKALVAYAFYKEAIDLVDQTLNQSKKPWRMDIHYVKLIKFIMDSRDLKVATNVYFDRAYYFAYAVNHGIVKRNGDLSRWNYIEEFSITLRNMATKIYFAEKDLKKIQEGRIELESLLENDMFIKMDKYAKMKEAVVIYLTSLDEEIDLDDLSLTEEKVHDWLLVKVYQGQFNRAKTLIKNLGRGTQSDPFIQAIRLYMDQEEAGIALSEDYLYWLSDTIEYRRTMNISKYAKKSIESKEYQEGLKVFEIYSKVYPQNPVVAIYKSILLVLNHQYDNMEIYFEKGFEQLVDAIITLDLEEDHSRYLLETFTNQLLELLKSISIICLVENLDLRLVMRIYKKTSQSLPQIYEVYHQLSQREEGKTKVMFAYNSLIAFLDQKEKVFKALDDASAEINTFGDEKETLFAFALSNQKQFIEKLNVVPSVFLNSPVMAILETFYGSDFKCLIFKMLSLDNNIQGQLYGLEDFNPSVVELSHGYDKVGLLYTLTDYSDYMKKIYGCYNWEDLLNPSIDLGVFLFGWSKVLSILQYALKKDHEVSLDIKAAIATYCETKEQSETTLLNMAHVLFKQGKYRESLVYYEKLDREKIRDIQSFNNNYIIAKVFEEEDFFVLNATVDQIKSVFRRLMYASELAREKQILLKKLEDSKSNALLLAWMINKYTLKGNENFQLAGALVTALKEVNPDMGAYYEDKVKEWQASDEVKVETGELSLDDLLKLFEGLPYLNRQVQESISQIHFRQSMTQVMEIIDEGVMGDSVDDLLNLNHAYIQYLSNSDGEHINIRKLFDYLIFLVQDFRSLDLTVREHIFLEGLEVHNKYFRRIFSGTTDYYCESLLAILSAQSSLEDMGKMTARVLARIKQMENIKVDNFYLLDYFRQLQLLPDYETNKKLEMLLRFKEALINNIVVSDRLVPYCQRVIEMVSESIKEIYNTMIQDKKFDYFISYSKRDFSVVNEIKKELERKGFSVWMDMDLKGSALYYSAQITKAMENSKTILFMLSNEVLKKYDSIYKYEFRPAFTEGKDAYPIWLTEDKWDQTKIEIYYPEPEKEDDRAKLKEMLTHFNGLEASRRFENVKTVVDRIVSKTL